LDVDLRDKELRLVAHVGRQRGGRALRDVVLLLAQPGLEAGRLARRQDDDLVFAGDEPGLDLDAEVSALVPPVPSAAGANADEAETANTVRRRLRRARILLPVLD